MMEIQKSNMSAVTLGALIRQSEAIVPSLRTGRDTKSSQGSSATSSRDTETVRAEERESAINALEARHLSRSSNSSAISAESVDGRARRALNAYLIQQNISNEENNSTLSAMLGVDLFA
jgi:hypothetical protein